MPWRGKTVLSRAELLGVITSHGPSRESYTAGGKSRPAAEAMRAPAARTPVSLKRLRATLSSEKRAAALLQRAVPV